MWATPMRRRWILVLMLVGLLAGQSFAVAETRVALVVGNSAYASTVALTNPVNDARDMSAALKRAGFRVIEAVDVGKRQFDAALRSFGDELSKADVALFFYAGHGMQVGLDNYLVPIDAKLERERDLEFEAVKRGFVLRQMEIDRDGKTTIIILDACRDNPLSRNSRVLWAHARQRSVAASRRHLPALAPSSRTRRNRATWRLTAMGAIHRSPRRSCATWPFPVATCRPP